MYIYTIYVCPYKMLQQAAKITFIFTNSKNFFVLNKPIIFARLKIVNLCPQFLKKQIVI